MPKRSREDALEGIDPAQVALHLIHFKVETCRTVDPEEVAEELFGDNQHLVVLHKGKHENPHWHFQGYTSTTPGGVKEHLVALAAGHSKKIASPKSRPVKRMVKEVTDVGFQYMMKEGVDSVVVSQGFTPEELEELHAKSEEHVASLKNQLYEYLEAHLTIDDVPKTVHGKARQLAMKYYLEAEKMPPPNLQKLVLWHMLRLAMAKSLTPRLYMTYVGQRI